MPHVMILDEGTNRWVPGATCPSCGDLINAEAGVLVWRLTSAPGIPSEVYTLHADCRLEWERGQSRMRPGTKFICEPMQVPVGASAPAGPDQTLPQRDLQADPTF
jgi:hypothetical protein